VVADLLSRAGPGSARPFLQPDEEGADPEPVGDQTALPATQLVPLGTDLPDGLVDVLGVLSLTDAGGCLAGGLLVDPFVSVFGRLYG
jgi:hypothetical protein